MVDLGTPPTNPFPETWPAGVSADGTVVIVVAGFVAYGQVYRWENGYTVELYTGPWLPGDARATGVSADASVVVGYLPVKWTEGNRLLWTATRWQQSALGPVQYSRDLLRPDVDGQQSYAYGVSSDGLVVVGAASGLEGYWPSQAFRWVDGTAVGLGTLGGPSSTAYAASADGSVIVGRADTTDGVTEAFRWQEGRMFALGMPPGDWAGASATGVSADGAIIVGHAWTADGNDASAVEPFIWDEAHGTRSFTELLTQNGIDLTDWDLRDADISADGRVIVGNGYHISLDRQEAWIVTIPEPSTPAGLATLAAALLLAHFWRKRKR